MYTQLEERFLLERNLLFDAIQDRGRMEYVDQEQSALVGKPKNEHGKELGMPFSSVEIPGKSKIDMPVACEMDLRVRLLWLPSS